jgi:hypothetical protein
MPGGECREESDHILVALREQIGLAGLEVLQKGPDTTKMSSLKQSPTALIPIRVCY